MPDWQRLVRERIGPLGLSEEREAEIHAELAGHLEDCRSSIEEAASDELEFLDRQAVDWRLLNSRIRAAEVHFMKDRLRVFWLPGLLVLLAAMAALRLMLQLSGIAILYRITQDQVVSILPGWMILLVALGAAASWWVRRQGGSVLDRAKVALIPAWTFLLLLVVLLTVSLVVDRHVPLEVKAVGFIAFAVSWVLLPAVALLAGALPFLGSKPMARTD